MISRSELMHHRLQAWMRENKCSDLEYIGIRNNEHYYRIDSHEVAVSSIIDFDEV